MKNRICVWIVLCGALWLLVGCGNNEATPTAVAQVVTEAVPTATDTAVPTETAVPTNTPVPTETPSPEPTATMTASATPTAVPTDTATPEPTATATRQPTVPAVRPTATPTTAVPVSAPVVPPAAPVPAGPNLIANPGFEAGRESWIKYGNDTMKFEEASSKPQFVHSGQYSAAMIDSNVTYFQHVTSNITAGTTYRAGAWVKVWSSRGEDRTISEDPGEYVVRICINIVGEDAPSLPTNICSGWVRPLDVWQYISVDAAASNDRVSVLLQGGFSGPDRPRHNEAYWDDVALGVSSIVATATPGPAVRPAPIPFDADALRDSMNFIRSQIEQMGGVLDRLYNGEPGKCAEYQGYYNAITNSQTYDGIPTEWQTIYNEYIFAVENTLSSNEGLNSLCTNGGGGVTQQNYGTGRQGINTSLERLIPAIDAANALLGG